MLSEHAREDMLASSEILKAQFHLTQEDRNYIGTKGPETIRGHGFQFINSRVAPAFLKYDGRQTLMKNHPFFIAQHLTATCCRGYISKSHGIGKGRALSEAEVELIVALIMGWMMGRYI